MSGGVMRRVRRSLRRGVLKRRGAAPAPTADRGLIEAWAAAAHAHTVVERIDSPPGFLADCVAAPGAITVGRTEQEALDEMESALIGWASLRVSRGYDLPPMPA